MLSCCLWQQPIILTSCPLSLSLLLSLLSLLLLLLSLSLFSLLSMRSRSSAFFFQVKWTR